MSVVERTTTPNRAKLAEPDPMFLKAAELIRENGWWQLNGTQFGKQPICASQAILRASCGSGLWLDHSEQFARSIGWSGYDTPKNQHGHVAYIADWNDTHGRTQGEVIEALERAAYGL